MTRSLTLPAADKLCSLTMKQRAVLDLLIEFKTSKEISRILDISPHTVDQRVEAAKTKLGATSRAELAVIYRDMLDNAPETYERLTYDDSCIPLPPDPPQNDCRVGATAIAPPVMPDRSGAVEPGSEELDYRVVPALFDGRWGTFARLATIVGISILMCIAFLGGLTILVQVSKLVASPAHGASSFGGNESFISVKGMRNHGNDRTRSTGADRA